MIALGFMNRSQSFVPFLETIQMNGQENPFGKKKLKLNVTMTMIVPTTFKPRRMQVLAKHNAVLSVARIFADPLARK